MISADMLNVKRELCGNGLTRTGIREIDAFISAETGGLRMAPWFDWAWITNQQDPSGLLKDRRDGGTDPIVYRGRVTKRIYQFFAARNIDIGQDILEEIGMLYKKHSLNGQFEYDITRNINWRAGEFGDTGSCFWTERAGARQIMMENGVYAIRVYEGGAGAGRAWFFDYGKYLVVFNGYLVGNIATFENSHGSTNIFANILASIFKCGVRQIDWLVNDGCPDGLIYINSETGYYIGARSVIDSLPGEFDLDIDTRENTCSYCGHLYCEYDLEVGRNGALYCQSCMRAISWCDDCGVGFFTGGFCRDGISLCCDCMLDKTKNCSGCGIRELSGKLKEKDGHLLCADCYEYEFVVPQVSTTSNSPAWTFTVNLSNYRLDGDHFVLREE